MSAMRDDELAFSSIGRDAMWMKIAIFGLGSGIAGLAGSLYAHYFRFIAPEQFEILQSSVILTMVVVGGLRTTWGPVVGALLLQALPQAISSIRVMVFSVDSSPTSWSTAIRSSRSIRPAIAWLSDSGCSWISLSMKCS